MNEEERLSAPNGRWRIKDHFVEIAEMIQSRTMPENLPPAESIKRLDSQRRKQPKAPKRPPSETQITGDSKE